jgi:DNA gyrase subunit B
LSEKIKALDKKGQARDKVSVWLGSNTHQAVMHTTIEATTNSCDLISDGNGDTIVWTLFNDKELQIEDNCSGIPLEGYTEITTTDINGNATTEKQPNYILLLATMFAGTKYDSLKTGKPTTGTNGLFLSILTLCSDYVEYTIGRPNGNIYYCSFENGYLKNDLQIIGSTDKTFSRIKYRLSDEVFTGNYFTYEELCDMANKQSSLINGKIKIIDIVNNREQEFFHENGIISFINELEPSEKIIDNIIICDSMEQEIEIKGEKATDKITINVVMNYSENEENNVNMEFLNRSHLVHHGTIYDGFIEGLRRSYNQYLKQEGKYKKNEKQITKEDVLCGLNYIINFTSLHPTMFQNQTKFSTDIDYFKDKMILAVSNFFQVYSVEQKQIMNKIADRLLLNKRSRETAEVNRKEAKKKLEQGTSNSNTRPEKFVPCISNDKTMKELILIEGDSSLNSVKLSRDKTIHSIYPLKGKPLNALKKSIDEIFKNDEITDIFQILQCGMEYNGRSIKGVKKFNIDDLDVSKIIAFCDEDEDGLHIRSLLICIFYVLAPEIIKQGHLYILDSPLYRIDTKDKTYLAYNEREKNDIIRNLNSNNIKFSESRFKGLGGLSVDLLSETAMHVKNRKLTQVTINDFEKAKEVLEMFMDDDSVKRKEYIEEHGEKYFDYSIYED